MNDLRSRESMSLLDRLNQWEKFRDNWQANIGRKSMFIMMDECKEAAVVLDLQHQRIESMKTELLDAAIKIERLHEALAYIATYSTYGHREVSRLGRYAKEISDSEVSK